MTNKPINELNRIYHDLQLAQTAALYNLSEKPSRQQSAADLEWLFFKLVRTFSPDLFIEAGAKDGRVSRRARRYLPKARIVAFEANPYTFERFAPLHHGDETSVEYTHLALSNEPGTVTFQIPTRVAGSDLRVDVGRSSLLRRVPTPDEMYTKVQVPANTLDLFFQDSKFETVCLWIDVEGANRQVLTGASRVLDSTQLLLIEVEDRRIWEDQWLRPAVQDFLYERGFLPVARDFQSRYQYNLLFLHQALIDHDRFRYLLTAYHSAAGKAVRESLEGRAGRG